MQKPEQKRQQQLQNKQNADANNFAALFVCTSCACVCVRERVCVFVVLAFARVALTATAAAAAAVTAFPFPFTHALLLPISSAAFGIDVLLYCAAAEQQLFLLLLPLLLLLLFLFCHNERCAWLLLLLCVRSFLRPVTLFLIGIALCRRLPMLLLLLFLWSAALRSAARAVCLWVFYVFCQGVRECVGRACSVAGNFALANYVQ